MKIAIQPGKGFSKRWIEYCEKKGISFKTVNCYHTDIIKHLEDCDALMWHFRQDNYHDMLFAKQLVCSINMAGKRVFPDINTSWHFNDKLGQKYLLESINAPLVPTCVFYDKSKAIEWAENTKFPKVFKLRSGAGSANVKLIKTRKQAKKLINKAFGKGFSQFDKWEYLRERFRKNKEGKDGLMDLIKGLGRLFIAPGFSSQAKRERGYVYFQDFIPNNDFDTRVIVIGERAFAIRRMVRNNDFRASGSGFIAFEPHHIDQRCIRIAFDVNKKLKAQCLAYDFVLYKNEPLILEISYGFSTVAYDSCPGFWDINLIWHKGEFIPQEWMVDLLL